MLSFKLSLLVAAALAASPALAMYKCKDADGRTAFQERPCEATGTQGKQINVRPASGAAPAPAPTAASNTAAAPADGTLTEAERLRKLNERDRKQRRLKDLNDREISDAEGRIRNATNKCERRMGGAQYIKSYANNNLAGATWEQSLSTEMQAYATQCAAEQTRLNAALDRLLAEKARLEQELAQ
ncbi:DUF4124 domain-containing protein [Comamonas sp.]|uniref:DUF4124 domain-containing protein n=1 Tax=Comamonas sp. TaxID=34028 RepID=UPI00289E3554|nr:DUF4124 domain-containing protein [Comamonas sp.]